MKPPLTPAQEEVFKYIEKFYEVHDKRSPTIREICSGVINGERIIKERRSSGSGYSLVRHLLAKGYLEEKFHMNVPYWVIPND